MKQHQLVIILAVVIGLIVGLPHIFVPRIISPQKYDPLQFLDGKSSSITMEEVYTYVPEVREILEGKFWVTDTQVAEYNGKPTPFAGETGLAWIMAVLAKLTGSVENAFVIADFLFPAVTFLLVYAIMMKFSVGQLIAALVGAGVVLWPELVALVPYPTAIVSALKSAIDPRDFLFISRNFHPQLSLPAYLFAFWLLIKVLDGERDQKDKRGKRGQILINLVAGLAVGFLFYTYIFNWTAFGLGMGLFVVFLSIKRPGLAAARPGLNTIWRLLIIFMIAGLTAAPYFFQIWAFRQSGLAEDFFLKLSLPKRGLFDLTARHGIFVLVFLIVSLFHRSLRATERSAAISGIATSSRRGGTPRNDGLILFLCFWVAPLILPDLMQNILGRDLEGKHWVRRIGYPMSIMGLGLMAGEIRKKWVNVVAGLALLAVLAYGVLVQVNMSRKSAMAYAVDSEKQELYDFINNDLPSGSVIASLGWDTIVNIPAKTHAFNFSPIGMRTIASTDETLERFLWTAAMYDKNEDWVEQAFGDNGIGTTRVYYFANADENQIFKTPPEKIEEIILRYWDIRQKHLAGEKPPFRLMLQLPK